MVTSAIAVGSFLAATGWVLERSFAGSVVAGAEEQLRGAIYGLLGAAQVTADRLDFERDLGDPRLAAPESGLYAYIEAADGTIAWRSPSLQVTPLTPPPAPRPPPGSFRFRDAGGAGLADVYQLGYTVIWEAAQEAEMTFWMLADRRPFGAEIAAFRRNAAIGVAGATLLLIVAQLVALRWGLAPVRRMTERIAALIAGRGDDIGQDYPRELNALAHTLNRFVESERETQARHRKALADLAHSLKTPLAVLRNAALGLAAKDRALLGEQLELMEATVAHQLSRAVAARTVVPQRPVALAPLVERLLRTLDRAYEEKGVEVALVAPAPVTARGDERDLMQMLGNLLENAYKYSAARVRVTLILDGAAARIVVEDDGSGIPAQARERVLARGARADADHAGHGIGLAIVVELAAAHGGALMLEESDLGGARATLTLPR